MVLKELLQGGGGLGGEVVLSSACFLLEATFDLRENKASAPVPGTKREERLTFLRYTPASQSSTSLSPSSL